MKLELKHLSAYFPYKVKVRNIRNRKTYEIQQMDDDCYIMGTSDHGTLCYLNDKEYKLILKPMEWFKDINSPEMNELNCDLKDQTQIMELANRQISLSALSYGAHEICCKNHIDIFGLIEEGLAEEENTAD